MSCPVSARWRACIRTTIAAATFPPTHPLTPLATRLLTPLVTRPLTPLAALQLVSFLASLLVPLPAQARPARIGFVLDGPWDRNAEILALVQQEIRELLGAEQSPEFPAAKILEADWTPAGAREALQRQLGDPEVDLIVAFGVVASDQACRLADPPKPVVAPVVIDPDIQGLPQHDGASGVHNLAYLTVPSAIERDVRVFRELVPFERVTVLLNHYIAEAMPGLEQHTRTLASVPGIEVAVVSAREWAAGALANLPADAQAVYILPLLQMSAVSIDSLIDGLRQRRLPSFSWLGEQEVERGVLAGVSPDIFPRLARRMAVTVQRILAGEEPGSLASAFTVGEQLTLNMKTARAIGFQPTWVSMSEAEIVGEERELTGPRITLVEAMQQAWAGNRDLAATERAVAAGAQSVRQARATLLPQADANATALLIDEDRAGSSFGVQAERSLSGELSATQLLFSEPAWARLSIERSTQRARELELDQTRLDVARAAGGAYLQVLRALTLERIRRENLRLTRQHLELARLRQSVGSAGLSDVYRWESELATNRKDAIAANADRNLAEMELNRILHRPVEAPFVPADVTLEDPEVAPFLELTRSYFEDRVSFRLLRDFLVADALRLTPEIARLDAGIAAARRSLSSATRAFYTPSLGLKGTVSRILNEGGPGSGTPDLTTLLPAGLGTVRDDTDWSVGLQLSFPLLRGGDRLAARARAGADLARAQYEREAAVERVEQRVRSAVHRAGASYAGIREARSAADWAGKNLELVADAYSRGAVSLIDLLDAQNAHIVAEQAAADAVYSFVDDFLEVQRAAGRFGFTMTPQERNDFGARLRTFVQQQGARPARD